MLCTLEGVLSTRESGSASTQVSAALSPRTRDGWTRGKIFIEPKTSDRKLKPSRGGSK